LRLQNYAATAIPAKFWDILQGNVTNGAIKREKSQVNLNFSERERYRANAQWQPNM